MNESQTRLDKIDPKLRDAGWGITPDSSIRVEFPITKGKVSASAHGMPLKADYILTYRGAKLAVVEAKRSSKNVSEGVMQAKVYADFLGIRFTYATNGNDIYLIDMKTGEEKDVDRFFSPDELWLRTFGTIDLWRDKFYAQPMYSDGFREPRYYQEIAVNRALTAIAEGRKRILLTLATGTGKTFIAFQIAYKLFQTRWNVAQTNTRPRILFLADRNVLANQAMNGFCGFPPDALVRIRPDEIKKDGRVPMNGSVFFTIFQTFMSGKVPYFGEYPKDFFDLVIIDECHRGGANDDSRWRDIMDYFDSAVQIGLTATPRCDVNANTYSYFGEPVYEYSLRQGINDGFLTPFRHCRMQSTIDDYVYSPEDEVLEGEVEEGRVYTEDDFYKGKIKIKQRDESRVREFMKYIREDEKTLVFCATQSHAAYIRDAINREHRKNPFYAVRVTSNDGAVGEQYLKDFQDNDKIIPTVLTTSEKLSTGVDALNVRNIVLMRPIYSMIEFKQIIGRGTRLYEGKYYFTIYDFVEAYKKFNDPQWDGEPVCPKCGNNPCTCEKKMHYDAKNDDDEVDVENEPDYINDGDDSAYEEKPKALQIRLSDNTVRNIQTMKTDMLYKDGRPVPVDEFIRDLFGDMPKFFDSPKELINLWSEPKTRKSLLSKMAEVGYGKDELSEIRRIIGADNCDLLDVLEYIAYNKTPIERAERTEKTRVFEESLDVPQKSFIDFLKCAYIKNGIDELEESKLSALLKSKFGSSEDGVEMLGGINQSRKLFFDFQKNLYC